MRRDHSSLLSMGAVMGAVRVKAPGLTAAISVDSGKNRLGTCRMLGIMRAQEILACKMRVIVPMEIRDSLLSYLTLQDLNLKMM